MIQVFISENSARLQVVQLEYLMELLPFSMREKAVNFRNWEDAQAYIIGKFLTRVALKRFGFKRELFDSILYNPYGKPYFPAEFYFNISHSGKFVVCAASSKYNMGVDIEKINRTINLDDFASQFTPQELSTIKSAVDEQREFFKYWTIKEAVMKADGRGLGIPLKDIVISDHVKLEGKKWYLKSVDIDIDYIGVVATDRQVSEIVFENVSLFENL